MEHGDIWDPIFRYFGLDGASTIATLVFISMVCNFLYRLIPDDATGWKGAIKPILKVLGLYASNRVTSGVTVNDVVKDAINQRTEAAGERIDEVHEQIDQRIEDAVGNLDERIDRGPGVNFGRSAEAAARRIVPIFLVFAILPALASCAAVTASSAYISQLCQSRDQIAALIAMVEKEPNHPKASAILAALDVACPLTLNSVRESRH